jgi:hypothetical protein
VKIGRKAVSGFLVLFLVIALAVEAAVLGTAYLTADEVECESIGPVPLYCTFSSTETISNVTMEKRVETSSTCYRNGEKVNCSEDFIQTNQEYYEEEFIE